MPKVAVMKNESFSDFIGGCIRIRYRIRSDGMMETSDSRTFQFNPETNLWEQIIASGIRIKAESKKLAMAR